MAGNGSEVIGVTAHSSGSLRLACVGVLEHALRLLLGVIRLDQLSRKEASRVFRKRALAVSVAFFLLSFVFEIVTYATKGKLIVLPSGLAMAWFPAMTYIVILWWWKK
jgi:hypothetical protein